MKRFLAIIAVSLIHLAVSQSAFAQISINLPKAPRIGKPKTDTNKQPEQTQRVDNNGRTNGSSNLYKTTLPNGTPVLLKSSVYVQAKTHNEYWKMKGQRNYSSWVPVIKFDLFYNNEKAINYTVEYTNPDGSAWYSEKLEQSSRSSADRKVDFQSPSPYGGVLDTKSTAATGTFGFKITNDDTKEVLYQGKFKVGKFSTANGGPDKNKFQFYVDHDWLMPYGTVGFHFAGVEVGGIPPLVTVWIKGDVSASDLEGRMFYKGAQIASTKDDGGASDYDERTTDMAAAFSPLSRWKRWQFQWNKVLFDNNGTFNRDNFPSAFYVDKNPGVYTVKIFRGGTQIRELDFTIGPDGRFVRPAHSDQIFMPYHTIVLPVKVTAADEKWNATAWKTDSFYSNPITGF